MSALTPIPQALAAEVAAGPARFRPADHSCAVLILACSGGDPDHVGAIGAAIWPERIDGSLMVDVTDHGRCFATAWAVVFSASDGIGHLIPFGARVLVLKAARASAAIGMIGTVQGGGLGAQILVDFGADIPDDDGNLDRQWVISEWAILPPADQPLIPEMPDMPSQIVNVQGDRRASVHELSEILVAEFGGHRPGETSIRAAIRVMRELRDQLAAARAEASRRGSIGPAERGDTDG